MHELVGHYENSVRPVYNASDPVDVRLGLTLTQILDLDEKNQVLTTNVWLEAEWFDERLRWNSSNFGSITSIRIPCERIWLPDIVLYNSVDDYTSGYMPSLAMVYNTSRVFWGPVIRFRSSCKIDITYFPFDDQVCRLKLGSWAYNGFQVNVWNRSHTMDLSNFVDNGEWELIGVKVRRNVVYYNCCEEPFPDVTFFVHLRRRIKYYFMNIIIPCSILSFLCLAGFLLPPESGEKITLGLSVLLTITVFMLMVADKMPQTSESISVISIYLMVVLATSCLSVLSSVLVLSIHHQRGKPHRVPHWLRFVVFGVVARVICVKTHTQYHPTKSGGSGRGKCFHGLSGRHKDRKTPRSPRRGRVATKESEFLKMEYTSSKGGASESPNVYPCTPPSEPLLPRSFRPPDFAAVSPIRRAATRKEPEGGGKVGHHLPSWRPASDVDSPIHDGRRNRLEKLGQGHGYHGDVQGHDNKQLLLCGGGGGDDNDGDTCDGGFEEKAVCSVSDQDDNDHDNTVDAGGLRENEEAEKGSHVSRSSPGSFFFQSVTSGCQNASGVGQNIPEDEAGIEEGGHGAPGEDESHTSGLAPSMETTEAEGSEFGSHGDGHSDDSAGRTFRCFLCGSSSCPHEVSSGHHPDSDFSCADGIAGAGGGGGGADETIRSGAENARRNVSSPYRSEEQAEFGVTLTHAPCFQGLTAGEGGGAGTCGSSRPRRNTTPALSADNSPRKSAPVRTSSHRSVSNVTYRSGEETSFCVRREVAAPPDARGELPSDGVADTSLCSSYSEVSSAQGTPSKRRGLRGRSARGRRESEGDHEPPGSGNLPLTEAGQDWGGEKNSAPGSGDTVGSPATAAANLDHTAIVTRCADSSHGGSATTARTNAPRSEDPDSDPAEKAWQAAQVDIPSKLCNSSHHHHHHHHSHNHRHYHDHSNHTHPFPGHWDQQSVETSRDARPTSGRPSHDDGAERSKGRAGPAHGVSVPPAAPARRECSRRSSSRPQASGGGGGLGDSAVIQRLIALIESKHRDEVKDEAVYREWHDVACVLDRLLFYVFLVITVVSSITILMMRPGQMEF